VQVLSEENQREIVQFCKKEGLVLLADEVLDTSLCMSQVSKDAASVLGQSLYTFISREECCFLFIL
jgi:aspartate/methionine/tyrosine aminotransferase